MAPKKQPVLTLAPLVFFALLFPGCAHFLQPQTALPDRVLAEPKVYRGVYHVHSKFSHDSKSSLKTISKTARRAGLDFVVITDHNNRDAAASLPQAEMPLIIDGEEISAPDGHLVALGTGEKAPEVKDSAELIAWIHERGGIAMLAHPVSVRNPWRRMEPGTFDGMEVYNFAHELYPANKFKLMMKAGFLTPHAFLRSFQKKPEASLTVWDELLKHRHVAAIGASDAHVHFKFLGFSSESLLLLFQAVTVNVIADSLEEKPVIQALGRGRSFLSFDVRGIARDFSFTAAHGDTVFDMGDEVPGGGTVLRVHVPQASRIRLISGGALRSETEGTFLDYPVTEAGAWRVEVYRDGKIWIISNPIYII